MAVDALELQLAAALQPAKWIVASDTLILHGRRICKPKPLCDKCAVRDDCRYYSNVIRRSSLKAKGPKPGMRARR